MKATMLDATGNEIYVGNMVIFGLSNRYTPINFGMVVEANEDDGWIKVKGPRNTKLSQLNDMERVFRIDSTTEKTLEILLK